MLKIILQFSIFAIILFFNFNWHYAISKQINTNSESKSLEMLSEKVYLDRLNVKFKIGSNFYNEWKVQNRKKLPKNLTQILEIYTQNYFVKPFIDDRLIKATNKRYFELYNDQLKTNKILETSNNFSELNLNEKTIAQKVENLEAIANINFGKQFDIKKLQIIKSLFSDLADIEYVDFEFKNYIFETPNDTLLPTQYYLGITKAFEAWELADPSKVAKVAIVDTGVLTGHTDLKDNIYKNLGEIGIDEDGKDKSTNGIDDDENGYIDDYIGWDFASSDSSKQDNNPNPGHVHGTHVAGIVGAKQNNVAGIAGIAKYVELIPIKCGVDDVNAAYIESGYQGILYSATLGAHTINCSWGGSGMGQAEAEVLQNASDLGSIVVAAAGNNGTNIAFMPASNPNVISVASSDDKDRKSGFSNYNIAVDIIAPGTQIMSTILNDGYAAFNGTSMASPITAAALGVLKANNETLSNEKLIALIRANSDNIDSTNPNFAGLIGSGRVNIEKALKKEVTKFAEMKEYKFYYPNNPNNITNEELIQNGDIVEIDFSIKNILDDCENVRVKVVRFNSNDTPTFFEIGNMKSGDIFKNTENDKIKYQVPDNYPLNSNLVLSLEIFDGEEKIGTSYINFLVNPVYRTMNKNNISATFNNIGHIGYNDFPQNSQGKGFKFKDGYDMLFEGALIVADTARNDSNRIVVSNIARASGSGGQDRHFSSNQIFEVKKFDEYYRGSTKYQDYVSLPDLVDSNRVNIDVKEYVYQFTSEQDSNYLILRYDITNRFNAKTENLFFGYYFDWDIGLNGTNNVSYWDYDNTMAIQSNVVDSSLHKVAVAPIDEDMINSKLINFYAFDNGGTEEDNIGVYDGFTRSEKSKVLSNGILRDKSNQTDASMAIGVGPITLEVGETKSIHFAIAAGEIIEDLVPEIEKARNKIKNTTLNIEKQPIDNLKQQSHFTIYPNPSKGEMNFKFNGSYFKDNVSYKLLVIDVNGNSFGEFEIKDLAINNQNFNLNLNFLLNGSYIAIIKSDNDIITHQKFSILK